MQEEQPWGIAAVPTPGALQGEQRLVGRNPRGPGPPAAGWCFSSRRQGWTSGFQAAFPAPPAPSAGKELFLQPRTLAHSRDLPTPSLPPAPQSPVTTQRPLPFEDEDRKEESF